MGIQGFHDDPAIAGARIWRRSRWGAVGSAFALALFLPLVLGAAALGLYLLFQGSVGTGVAAVLLVCAGVVGALIQLLWRNMRGKMGAAITLTDVGMQLELRAGRSATHRTEAVREFIAYKDMAAIEMRIEAYPSQGMATMQRCVRLTRRNGPAVFLYEERGLGLFENGNMLPITTEIAERAGIPVNDLGVVEGGGGLFAAWFLTVPDWSAAAVSPERAEWLFRRVNLTNRLASVVAYET